MAFIRFNSLIVTVLLLGIFFGVDAKRRGKRHDDKHWVDTWTTMPQLTEMANLPLAPFNASGSVFVDSTIRQTIHTSIGGDQIRIRISNAFGVNDLSITAVTVALPVQGAAGVSAIQPQTLHNVTFGGHSNYTIPNGALVVSDPIRLSVKPQSMITITMYLADGQETNLITSHPGSRTTSWMAFGNQVHAANLTITDPGTQSTQHWYFLSAVEVLTSQDAAAFAIVGDSITDGRGSDTDKNDRWPDLVLARMQEHDDTSSIAVLNQAAGGNRILYDGLGPNALGRIDRDVLSHSGVQYAMIFEGVNDIGTAATDSASQYNVGERVIAALAQIALRIQALDISVFAATITPFSAPGYNTTVQPYSDPEREKTRQKVNKWIRESGVFDEVLDFDAVIRNKTHPEQIQIGLQGGDFLHPNSKGYKLLAERFDLSIFDQD